jgi:serine/threonine-protein kinase RsbW
VEVKMVLCLPRDAESVPVSRRVLDGCLETLGVTPDTRADIALALSEACSNVVRHAGLGEEYEVRVVARNRRCSITVVNTSRWNGTSDGERAGTDGERAGIMAIPRDPAPLTAEQGRGLQIIDAVVDNLQLTGSEWEGTTVRFEKILDWLPGAAGQHLLDADGGS